VKNLAGADITTADHITVTFPVGTDLTGATGTLKTTGQPVGIALTFGTDGLGRPTATFLCPTPIATKKRFTLALDGIKNPDPAGPYSALISAENSTFNAISNTGHDTAIFS